MQQYRTDLMFIYELEKYTQIQQLTMFSHERKTHFDADFAQDSLVMIRLMLFFGKVFIIYFTLIHKFVTYMKPSCAAILHLERVPVQRREVKS